MLAYTQITTFLLGFVGLAVPTVASGNIASDNVVGYMTTTIKHGENVIGLPTKVGEGGYVLSDITPMLIDGDRVLYEEGSDEQWAVIYEGEDGVRHAYVDGLYYLADDCELPSIGTRQILIVRRSSDEETTIPLSGEFNTNEPLLLNDYVIEPAPLDKLRLDKSLVDSLTVTNTDQSAYQTIVSKQFALVLKDGTRLRVKIDPAKQIIVDAKTDQPLGISSGEIEQFGVIGDEPDVPLDEKMTKSDISKITADVSAKSRGYNTVSAIRSFVIGELWDKDHPIKSILIWFTVSLSIGFFLKLIDNFWGCVFRWFMQYLKPLRSGLLHIGYWLKRLVVSWSLLLVNKVKKYFKISH